MPWTQPSDIQYDETDPFAGFGKMRRDGLPLVEQPPHPLEEVRFAGREEGAEFWERFLTGYDRQRLVREADVLLRATIVGNEAEAAP